MPIQSQGIITRDNVSVDVSAVAYFKVVDAVKSVVAIENVYAAIDQIAQTTLRKVVGQHTLDQTLSETDKINLDIRAILDVTTVDWGVEVTLVELKDIQLPDSMKRAMARQAEAEREKRAKIINAEGESLAAAALGRRVGHDDGPPAGAAAAQPAEPGRDRRGQEHHRRVPGTADDHDRRARVVPGPRTGRGRSAADTGDRPRCRDGDQRHGGTVTADATATRRRIVVGVDGSPSSLDALRWGRCMADALHAEIDAVTSWDYPASYGDGRRRAGGVGSGRGCDAGSPRRAHRGLR